MATTWHQDSIEGGVLRVRIDQEGRSVNSFLRGRARRTRGAYCDRTSRSHDSRCGLQEWQVGQFHRRSRRQRAEGSARRGNGSRSIAEGQKIFQRAVRAARTDDRSNLGSCLGGGLEFAMACTYRVADDDRKTLLGLPEVLLGLVPGWGGTVRLPRLVGLEDALGLILTGEMANGRQARSKGLVHDVVPNEALDHVAEEIIRRHPVNSSSLSAQRPAQGKPVFSPARRPLRKRLFEINGVMAQADN